MEQVKVSLLPLVVNINLPTVLKTAILPGDTIERLFIATQIGVIYYLGDNAIETFLDIRSRVLELGTTSGGYDERGLLGLAFHPNFTQNGLFYLHYSLAGSQGPGALSGSFQPNPCDMATLNLVWTNRTLRFNHIDTVEEWILPENAQPKKQRTLLNIRRPFLNHNGVNSLNFSPETGKLVLTTGDGGSGYDPFNLSQNDMEIAGKIIEIDLEKNIYNDNPLVVTRFDELPDAIQETLTVIAKGVRNIPGISFQRRNNRFIKCIGNVGQDLVESLFSFIDYTPIPVTELVKSFEMKTDLDLEGFVNFGWRGWEGNLPTSIIRSCSENENLDEKTIAYYDDVIHISADRLLPLTCYFHEDSRGDKFGATALTGVQSYLGNEIPDLTGSIVFTDLARNEVSRPPARGVLAYTTVRDICKLQDYTVIEIDYDFGAQPAYYVSLGSNQNQTKLYLGVYGSMMVSDLNQGTIFEIIP